MLKHLQVVDSHRSSFPSHLWPEKGSIDSNKKKKEEEKKEKGGERVAVQVVQQRPRVPTVI